MQRCTILKIANQGVWQQLLCSQDSIAAVLLVNEIAAILLIDFFSCEQNHLHA